MIDTLNHVMCYFSKQLGLQFSPGGQLGSQNTIETTQNTLVTA